jgi:hypothetical protein
MAIKKAKKAAVKHAEPRRAESAPMAGLQHFQDWLIILLGALGLATSLGYIYWPGFDAYFPFAWPVLVIVIGATNLMNKHC